MPMLSEAPFKKGFHVFCRFSLCLKPSPPAFWFLGFTKMTRLLSFIVVFMVLFLSFVHSSRTCLQSDGEAEDKARVAQDLEIKSLARGDSAIVVDDSAREVPTGPDPLHHNSNPPRP